MMRRIANIFALGCALLFIVAIYDARRGLNRLNFTWRSSSNIRVWTYRGVFGLFWDNPRTRKMSIDDLDTSDHDWGVLGIRLVRYYSLAPIRDPPVGTTIEWQLRVPEVWLACVFAIPPLLLLVKRKLQGTVVARPVSGHCKTCGYDMRTSPDRCPECRRPVG